MEAKEPTADYPFSQAALWQRCLDLQPTLERDAALLVPFGVTAGRITQFTADTATFGEMEPDDVLVQEGVVVTEAKEVDRKKLEMAIQEVMGIVGLKHHPRTASYKRFGVSEVSKLPEADLHLAGKMCAKQGRKYLAEYTEKGLTLEMLDIVDEKTAEFMEALLERKSEDNDRQEATRARILFANKLWAELVALCAAGQVYWRFKDAQKAEEYVADPASGSGPVKEKEAGGNGD